MSPNKRKHLNIEEKSRVLTKLENGTPNKDLAKEYGVPHSTISTIWKQREKIKTLFETNHLKMKKARPSKHKNIEEALLKWIKSQRANNMKINGPILQHKANYIARQLGEKFVCSLSWVQRFRVRHGIRADKNCEIGSILEQWKLRKWPLLCEGYGPEDIFNAEETALCYNMTPDNILNVEGNCYDGNTSLDRLTIMAAANMAGTVKKKLLVIGKYKQPRCFNKMTSLPVTYENNVNAWMNSEIFERWLRNWDEELNVSNKKILLLVNKCSAHSDVANLQCIKLVFLTPNVFVRQPMKEGVIRSLKSHYRKLQLLHITQNLDNQKSFTVLDAILKISEAWEKVSQSTIANSFKESGLTISSSDDEVPLSQLCFVNNDEEDIHLVHLAENLQPALTETQLEQFIDIDDSIAICSPDEDDAVEIEVKTEEVEEEFSVPTLSDGLNAVSVLRKMMLFKEQYDIQGDYDNTLNEIQCELRNLFNKSILKRIKIQSF